MRYARAGRQLGGHPQVPPHVKRGRQPTGRPNGGEVKSSVRHRTTHRRASCGAVKRRWSSPWLVACSLLAAVTAVALGADGEPAGVPLAEQIAGSTQQLATLRQRITEHRNQIENLAVRGRATSSALDDLAREMGLVKTLLVGLENRERMLSLQSDSLRARLLRQREELALRQESLAHRLRSLYMRGPNHRLEMVLTARSFSGLVARLRFGTMLARLDQRLIAETRQQSRQVYLDQQQLQSALVGIWQAREEAAQERERIAALEAERSEVLRDIEEQTRRKQAELRDLRQRESQIVELLAELEQRRLQRGAGDADGEGGTLAAAAGRLAWPVSGEVVRPFGRSVHPEFKTVTVNNGIYIAAAAGTPVHAIAAGTIEFADDLPGFGLCIIVDHGDGYYTLYANLARVYVTRGRQVGQGEVVAEVGRSLDRNQPQLYFEIRRGRTPLNPTDWLRPAG